MPTDPTDRPSRRSGADWLVPITLVATVAVNGLANALRFGGQTTGSVSARYPTLLTPAGYAFSIWSVIYLGLLAFSVYALSRSARPLPAWPRIRAAFIVSNLCNGLWIVVWHHRLIALSAVVIVVLLASVLVIYRSLDDVRPRPTPGQRFWVLVPFSLYAAWLSVATILNITVALRAFGFDGGPLSPEAWAIALMGVAAALALVVALPRRDAAWLFVVAWALAAIGVARGDHPTLRLVSGVLAGGLAVVALVVIALLALAPRRRDSPAEGASGSAPR